MTRLTHDHIANIPTQWENYAHNLKDHTGLSLFALACRTLDLDMHKAHAQCHGQHLAIIPLNTGEGVIAGFDASLQSIAAYLGFDASILPADDAGFALYHAEAFDMAIWADDTTFIAENKHTKHQVENGIATGRGFAEALHTMLPTKQETILVRGCGEVGRHAAFHLAKRGHKILACDTVYSKAHALTLELAQAGYETLACLPTNVRDHTKHVHALFDAAPIPALLDELPINNTTIIAAPCVPCLWKDLKCWHDPLQLGTAVMLIAAATKSPCTVCASTL